MLYKASYYKFYSKTLHFWEKCKKLNLSHKNQCYFSSHVLFSSYLKNSPPECDSFVHICQYSLFWQIVTFLSSGVNREFIIRGNGFSRFIGIPEKSFRKSNSVNWPDTEKGLMFHKVENTWFKSLAKQKMSFSLRLEILYFLY